ncbi:hypothetical protein [Staphylococcus epidermidis]|uniref:hypothetical protein n=1 Tax=Staphylococcus epidermidis TaxID=1282 RepID=UPI0021A46948|nr:hypothetical protein [Staphylococcus epidermidis]MCT2094923.1 hypothetical protein [Staphylococcus epidermidis]MCT2125340.1 hypothetical protein [Staphylococcus epidermidis]
MERYYTIVLKNGNNERKIQITKDKVLENENSFLTLKELYEFLDPEKYNLLTNKKISGSTINTLILSAKQFYKEVKKTKNPKDKRKTLYFLGELHNNDGSPIPRINNRKKINDFNMLFRVLLIKVLYNDLSSSNGKKLLNWLNEFGFINKQYLDDYYDINDKDKVHNDKHITIQSLKKEGIIPSFTYIIKDKNKDYIQSTELKGNFSIIDKIEMSDKKAISLLNNYFNKISSKLLYSLKSSFEYLNKENLIDYGVEYIGEVLVSNDRQFPILEHTILTGREIQQYLNIKELIKKQMLKEGTYKFYNEKKYINRVREYIYDNGIETTNGIKYFKKISVVYKVNSKINYKSLNDFVQKNSTYNHLLLEDNEILTQKYKDLLIASIINSNSNKFINFNEELEEMIEGSFGDIEDLFNNDKQKILNFKLMTNELESIASNLLNNRHSNNLDNKLSNLSSIFSE